MVFWKYKVFFAPLLIGLLLAGSWGWSQRGKPLVVINDPKSNIAFYEGMSTSAELAEGELISLINELRKPLIIVDLREESHWYVNGVAMSLYIPGNDANRGRSLEEIEAIEVAEVHDLNQSTWGFFWGKKWLLTPYRVRSAILEREVVEGEGASYVRIPITDHTCPNQAQTERLTTFFRELQQMEPRPWVHFHCQAGRGRSKTAAAMLAIFRGGPIDEILAGDWGDELSLEKREFLTNYSHLDLSPKTE